MTRVRIRPASELEEQTRAALEDHGGRIRQTLPEAEIEHVGSTAIADALTKGDVDLLVRVPGSRFATAAGRLGELYEIHQPGNWTPTLASFADPNAAEPPVGVQLVAAGSDDDWMFGAFRDALRSDPELLADYNTLKRRLDGLDYPEYTAAKGAFIERILERERSRR